MDGNLDGGFSLEGDDNLVDMDLTSMLGQVNEVSVPRAVRADCAVVGSVN